MKTTLPVLFRCSSLALVLAAGCAGSSAQKNPSASAASSDETTAKLTAALANPKRSEKNRARDVYRHPAETLGFFGLKDTMTVIELAPGGGWYTEILAPVLKDHGKLIVTTGNPETNHGAKEFRERLGQDPDMFAKVAFANWDPPSLVELGTPGSVDLVLTFRNLHGWLGGKAAEAVLKAAFNVLKPGGVLGLVDHRANPGTEAKGGYVAEEQAIALATAAGFKLDAKSEINANPKDTKDYAEGVWTLPPTLRLGDKDKEKYMAIGESDRMTLRFVKPAN